MFIHLSRALTARGFAPEDVFNFHPLQLTAYIDLVWEQLRVTGGGGPGTSRRQIDPGIGNLLVGRGALGLADLFLQPLGGPVTVTPAGPLDNAAFVRAALDVLSGTTMPTWHHMIYGYLIENTRVYDIVERVLHELVTGERLGQLSPASHRWARATEELMFRDQGFFLSALTSGVRPDARATRRNAYHRMFAMDLNHGDGDKPTYPYVQAEASNASFVGTFEALLREVWRGYINARNTSGPNSADDAAIAEYASRLHQMLGDRRERGNLTREEFVITAMMTWFELTVGSDTPIVVDLQAQATTPEERLRKLGARVGATCHSKSRSLFDLATRVSSLLIAIESGAYDAPNAARTLYDVNLGGIGANPVAADMVQTIIHWSLATGHEVKAQPVHPTMSVSSNGAAALVAAAVR